MIDPDRREGAADRRHVPFLLDPQMFQDSKVLQGHDDFPALVPDSAAHLSNETFFPDAPAEEK